MNASQLMLSPEAFNAWLLRQVIEDTTPAGEPSADAHTRAGAILEMFRGMVPGGAMESVLACHCIQLRFSARAALRDAEVPGQDAKTQRAMRVTAIGISRELRVWVGKLEKAQARKTAEAVEATTPKASRPGGQAVASAPRNAPAAEPQTPPPPPPVPSAPVPSAPVPSAPVPSAQVPSAPVPSAQVTPPGPRAAAAPALQPPRSEAASAGAQKQGNGAVPVVGSG